MAKIIGVDEAGKGDYFGYLVVAAVCADEKNEPILKSIGVKDSKMLSDASVRELAAKIKKLCQYEIVKISPERYNTIYKKFHSLNKLLAWGHARSIENLLEKTEWNIKEDYVITDKFADERFLKEALFEKGRKARVIQKINGESYIAVAAASILARNEFLATLRMLGREIGFVLPKGATHVEETARQIVEKHGTEILDKVVKIHFKTTKRVLQRL